jgi:hypothetical protein
MWAWNSADRLVFAFGVDSIFVRRFISLFQNNCYSPPFDYLLSGLYGLGSHTSGA